MTSINAAANSNTRPGPLSTYAGALIVGSALGLLAACGAWGLFWATSAAFAVYVVLS